MDAATLNAFCAARELTFVETVVKQGTKGAWFEDRKRTRRFVADADVTEAVRKMRPMPPLFASKPGDIKVA
ncbi:MAG: hypothetical protein KBG84_01855 [Planctomycetes bacterium]|nr:hypothetical protein [Planctomycetota bacterium]